jgi:hypothetical protein
MSDTNKTNEAGDQAVADLLKMPVQLVQLMRKSVSWGQPAEPVVQEEEPVVQLEAAQATAPTERPWAAGLDEWHAANNNTDAADAAEREKQAIEAKKWQEERALVYAESGGQTDIGGWCGQQVSPFARPRNFDWRFMPRGTGWR